MFSISELVSDFSDLFFPHTCAGCGTNMLTKETPICLRCIHELPVTNFHEYANNPVERIFLGRIPLETASAFCYFTRDSVIQHLLHQLKYNGRREVGVFLGNLMGQRLKASGRFNSVSMLVPLPLFASRQKKRGYNQAALICEGIGAAMQLPVATNAVLRITATETQTKKNRIQRWQNMEGRFSVSLPTILNNQHILLVDDVVTTGATLEACGEEILSVNNTLLSIATLAFTV
jgi:ComF family protein